MDCTVERVNLCPFDNGDGFIVIVDKPCIIIIIITTKCVYTDQQQSILRIAFWCIVDDVKQRSGPTIVHRREHG